MRPWLSELSMVSANSKMADMRSTLLECSVKIRQGRKWKSRWCVMTRQSPVSAEVILKFYKDQNALLTNKELSRERVCVSAANYCGLEYGFRYPKNLYVLTVVLSSAVILLSFQTHEKLLEWYHKVKITLPSAPEFKSRVSVPNKGKLPHGRATVYFYSNHFAITPETPTKLISAWDLSKVIRYGNFNGGFAFSVRASKGSTNHFLLLDHAESIKNHFDSATVNLLPSRWSAQSETYPATREEVEVLLAEKQRLLNDNDRDIGNTKNGETSCHGDRSQDGEEKEGEAQETETLLDGADQNSNVNIHSVHVHSESGRASVCLESSSDYIELTEFRTETSRTDASTSRTSGSGNVNLLSEETTFGNDLLPRPQNTPIREQEYEVMASFDHYRSSMHEEVDGGALGVSCSCEHDPRICPSHVRGSSHGGGGAYAGADMAWIQHLVSLDRFKLNFPESTNTNDRDDRDYVNIPSSKSKTLPNSKRNKNSLLPPSNLYPSLPGPTILDAFNFSPPSSPPPPPPGVRLHQHRQSSSTISSRETNSLQGRLPSLDSTQAFQQFDSLHSQVDEDMVVPIPFQHDALIKPAGPIACLAHNSQGHSETSSYSASGSEYDSSHYSSAASSRHNSFDRDPFLKPPPIPPKPANRLPSVEALLSAGSSRQDFSPMFESSQLSPFQSTSQGAVPPIPPKPDHLRGKPVRREPPSPSSPLGQPPFLSTRKRCNTVPSFATSQGDTEWIEVPEEGDEGYLLMKPAYDEKLRNLHTRSRSVPDEEAVHHSQTLPKMPSSWMLPPGGSRPQSPKGAVAMPPLPPLPPPSVFQYPSPGSSPASPSFMDFIPQSPIHGENDIRIQALKRSATFGGFRPRVSRSPSFTGRRPSLLRNSQGRRSLGSGSPDPRTRGHRSSDISLSSVPKLTVRRKDKYGSLGHPSLSLAACRVEEERRNEEQDTPTSPVTPITPDEFQELKDDLDKFASLPLSPPSSVNSDAESPHLSPASSTISLHQQLDAITPDPSTPDQTPDDTPNPCPE